MSTTDPRLIERVYPPQFTARGWRYNRDHVTGVGALLDDDLIWIPELGRFVMAEAAVAGLPRYYGPVADEAAMLALHAPTAYPPRWVAAGDKCRRTDTGAVMECVAGNGTSAGDWLAIASHESVAAITAAVGDIEAEIADLATALAGKADSTHTHPLSQLTQSGAAVGQVATWTGSAWVPQTPSGTSGAASVAVAFASNSAGRLSWAYSAGMRDTSSEGVWSAYVRYIGASLSSATYPTLLRLGSSAGWLRINRASGGTRADIAVRFADGNIRQLVSSGSVAIDDGAAHTLVLTSDGTANGMVIYYDGSVIASGAPGYTGAEAFEASPTLYIGNDSTGSSGFSGLVTAVGIWAGTALTAGQVADLLADDLSVAATWALGRNADRWPVDAVAGARATISAFGVGTTI